MWFEYNCLISQDNRGTRCLGSLGLVTRACDSEQTMNRRNQFCQPYFTFVLLHKPKRTFLKTGALLSKILIFQWSVWIFLCWLLQLSKGLWQTGSQMFIIVARSQVGLVWAANVKTLDPLGFYLVLSIFDIFINLKSHQIVIHSKWEKVLPIERGLTQLLKDSWTYIYL